MQVKPKIRFVPQHAHQENRLYDYQIVQDGIPKGKLNYEWRYDQQNLWYADRDTLAYLGVPVLWTSSEIVMAPFQKWKWGIRHIVCNEITFEDGLDFENDAFRYEKLKYDFLEILEFAAQQRKISR